MKLNVFFKVSIFSAIAIVMYLHIYQLPLYTLVEVVESAIPAVGSNGSQGICKHVIQHWSH